MTRSTRWTCRAACACAAVVAFGACSLFQTREPEPPGETGGTFLQADTPEQVVSNVSAAVRERNTQNYRRSLSTDLTFQPTATAEARDPIWSGWGVTEEELYFSTLVAASAPSAVFELALNDESLVLIDERTAVLDATYVLNAPHNRPEVPIVARGRLSWRITQGDDGLWELSAWTDQELAEEPSWSDLKADFAQ